MSGYLSRARAARIAWPLPEDLDDGRLEALLFPPPSGIPADQRPLPDWAWVHRELRRPDVTLALLWEEYRAGAPDGFGYSWVLRSLSGLGRTAEADVSIFNMASFLCLVYRLRWDRRCRWPEDARVPSPLCRAVADFVASVSRRTRNALDQPWAD